MTWVTSVYSLAALVAILKHAWRKFTKEQIDRIDRATRPCLMTVYLLSR